MGKLPHIDTDLSEIRNDIRSSFLHRGVNIGCSIVTILLGIPLIGFASLITMEAEGRTLLGLFFCYSPGTLLICAGIFCLVWGAKMRREVR